MIESIVQLVQQAGQIISCFVLSDLPNYLIFTGSVVYKG